MVTYSEHVRCAGCRRLTARETAHELGAVMYGPCCWEKLRSEAANGWECKDCHQLLPDEDMVTYDLCKQCAQGRQWSVPG